MPPMAQIPDALRIRWLIALLELDDEDDDVSVPLGNVPFSTIVWVPLTGPI